MQMAVCAMQAWVQLPQQSPVAHAHSHPREAIHVQALRTSIQSIVDSEKSY